MKNRKAHSGPWMEVSLENKQCYLLLEEVDVLSQKFFKDDLGNECYLINYIIWCAVRGWTCASSDVNIISWHIVV